MGLSNHSALIKDDFLYVCGNNQYGQLGLGFDTPVSPYVGADVFMKLNDNNWKQVACGNLHTLAIKDDGTLWAWGRNNFGQLGIGNTTDQTSPVQVGTDIWKQVSCGYYHTLAIKDDGTLWAWGYNGNGQLGIGSTAQQTSPIQVGTDNTWKQVACGYRHTLAIKDDGTLWAWGNNSNGQLGIGHTTQQTSPIQVGIDNTWKQVTCGGTHTLAIKDDGTLWAWGLNDNGQLGIGNTTDQISPVQVGTDIWKQVACGYTHTLAIKDDGTLWAWGFNNRGQLGIGNTTDQTSPVQVGTDNNWKQVACGNSHTLAIKDDGTLWAWGSNSNGQLGIGNTTEQTSPVQISDMILPNSLMNSNIYISWNKSPEFSTININKSSLWYTHNGEVNITLSITDEENDKIQYKLLINNIQYEPIEGFTAFQSPPVNVGINIPHSIFTEKENEIKIIIQDDSGMSSETEFTYTIYKENKDTIKAIRNFDFPSQFVQLNPNKTEILYGKGLSFKDNVLGSGTIATNDGSQVITLGRSTISGIEVEGENLEDSVKNVDIIEDMVFVENVGGGSFWESELNLDRFKKVNNISIKVAEIKE